DDAGKLEAQSGNILNNLANGNVPLGNFFGNGAWSLLDLIFAVIAAVLSIYLIVGAVLKRRRDQGIDSYTEEEVKQQGNVLKVLAIAAGVLTIVVWLILDDLSTPVTWINKWTLPVVIIFIVHIAAFFAYKIRAHKIAD
ncbi:MAG: hypothetical protein LBN12_05720, partial [Clostridiales Family XIII bacterium]|nr:hypothetical protein [Clostridiales Family XIII bacterium]